MPDSIFELTARRNDGSDLSFGGFSGKLLLIVNTASKCGFTPQYEGLEALHREYGSRGLVVLGFPCDQFAHQEPGSDEEIAAFCKVNFGVTFALMAKVEVNGSGTHPVFAFLKERAPGAVGGGIKWNFTKFMVSRDGRTVRRFAPSTEPMTVAADIEKELAVIDPVKTPGR
jgi:glutathione peroxidase